MVVWDSNEQLDRRPSTVRAREADWRFLLPRGSGPAAFHHLVLMGARVGRPAVRTPVRVSTPDMSGCSLSAADTPFGERRVMTSDVVPADVTVAVATINRPSQLVRCVTAILAAPTLPAELVIVDQSADTHTGDLVAAAGWERLVPLKYVRQPGRGLATSRNLAIALASRPIVVFTDDDCVPDPAWLAGIVAGFAGMEQADAVTGRILPLGPDRPGFHAMSTRSSRVRTVYRGRSLPWRAGSGANTAVSRRWLERIGGFDERLGAGSPGRSAEDMDLIYRLLRAGATIRYEPDAIVFHERQAGAQRLATSLSYGFGMGALCVLWARRRDPYALWMLGGWGFDRGRALLGACLRRRWWRIPEELLMLRGATRGVAHGLRRSSGDVLEVNAQEVSVTVTARALTSGNTR